MITSRGPVTSRDVGVHYDELDPFYRDIWGEHVHHGYWATGREQPEEATTALVDLVADRLRLAPGMTVCDIGCGYGATAQLLAERYGAHVTGLTVSAAQARIGGARVPAAGALAIRHADWLANDMPPASFARAYAIESSEHMPDKQAFFDEAHRTLQPGGRLAVCVWLARSGAGEWETRHLLEPICREGRLPHMGDEADYRRLAAEAGFTTESLDDISRRVRRTWSICLRRVAWKLLTDRRYLRFLLDSRAANRVFLLTLVRMIVAYRTGALRYGLFVFAKAPA